MSGRISDIVIHPQKRSTWYVAVGSGGVWKTENAGTTWIPIFDGEGSYSIGCLALDPANPEVVWVGTGENVSGRHVGIGDGVYKSLNGGRTWTNMGLARSEHIGRILVDPRDPRVVYVAAEGPLWSAGGDRGLYKTADGGRTWTLALEISKDTGVTSAEFDPGNPDVLYAAAYQRRRSVAAFMGGGPESGIYKSEDAGRTWRKLTVGCPRATSARSAWPSRPSIRASSTPRSRPAPTRRASTARRTAARAGRSAAPTSAAAQAPTTTRRSSPIPTASTASTRWTRACG
jgi:photosystem II stability/assembly factor-like uncharacterized protein